MNVQEQNEIKLRNSIMTEELDILRIISEKPEISQRKIAEQTGISLGQVNFLIKKCVKKGLVKLEGQTPKSIKYNLTPKGIAEKAALTLEYIKVSYNAVNKLSSKILDLSERYANEKVEIMIYGSKDEMMDIIVLVLGNKVSYETYPNLIISTKKDQVCFCWDESIKDDLESKGIKAVNILE